MGKAIRHCQPHADMGMRGHAEVYRLDPPHEGREYVMVSAVDAFGAGPETYIFPASEDGKVTDWLEMEGSFKGALDHVGALRNAGYEIEEAGDA